jgi:hypothetical protein
MCRLTNVESIWSSAPLPAPIVHSAGRRGDQQSSEPAISKLQVASKLDAPGRFLLTSLD